MFISKWIWEAPTSTDSSLGAMFSTTQTTACTLSVFTLLYPSYISKILILSHYSWHLTFPSLRIQSISSEHTQWTSCKLFASSALTNPTDKLCLHARFLANSEIRACSPWSPWLNHSFPRTWSNHNLQAAIKCHLRQGSLLILHPWPSLLPLPYIT